jgi:FlaA1/EpsC-like NDP-sugar epimerase
MSRIVIKGTQVLLDLVVLSIAFWLAFLFRFEFQPNIQQYKLLFFTWPYVILFKYLVMVLFGVPNFSWRYVGTREATRIWAALTVASVVLVSLRLGLADFGGHTRFVVIPLGILAIDYTLSFLGITGIRFVRRIAAERTERSRYGFSERETTRTLLIGAGRAGVLVAREVEQNPSLGMKIVGFVDDDPMKTGTVIQGHKVLGDTASISAIAEEREVDQVIICIASAPGAAIRRIVEACEDAGLPMKIIPGIYEILDGRVSLSRLREVSIEDLLGREAVELDTTAIGEFLTGKRVLVTGAGGSIGSELCRQVLRFSPESLVLVERSENALFEIDRELAAISSDTPSVPVIADICDEVRLEQVFRRHRPQVVFHAAAHKHVPMMEHNPGEALKNNVFGTQKVADAANRHEIEAFVMISTDKAVNPTSVMGASKRLAEMYVQSLGSESSTKYVAVRFGNVLGSAGSVIPVFKRQIANGGPVTVTHPEMRRYFMTIPEACQLVMQAGAMGKGGEIFVLDMGEPVKIVDLARDLIRLSGLSEEEVPILFTGVRPGEKLFEELSTAEENMDKTRHPKIFIGRIATYDSKELSGHFDRLVELAESGLPRSEVRMVLREIIPEMQDDDDELVKEAEVSVDQENELNELEEPHSALSGASRTLH